MDGSTDSAADKHELLHMTPPGCIWRAVWSERGQPHGSHTVWFHSHNIVIETEMNWWLPGVRGGGGRLLSVSARLCSWGRVGPRFHTRDRTTQNLLHTLLQHSSSGSVIVLKLHKMHHWGIQVKGLRRYSVTFATFCNSTIVFWIKW